MPDILIEDKNYFSDIAPDEDYIKMILKQDYRKLDTYDSVDLSAYNIALSQYNIYRQYSYNVLYSKKSQLERNFEIVANTLVTNELLKEYKSRKNAILHLMTVSKDLNMLDEQILMIKDKIRLIEGMDKTISEMIAAFKRELTRRDNELYSTRQERR